MYCVRSFNNKYTQIVVIIAISALYAFHSNSPASKLNFVSMDGFIIIFIRDLHSRFTYSVSLYVHDHPTQIMHVTCISSISVYERIQLSTHIIFLLTMAYTDNFLRYGTSLVASFSFQLMGTHRNSFRKLYHIVCVSKWTCNSPL